MPDTTESLIRELYRISGDYTAGFDAQIVRLLRAGAARLDLDIALLAEIAPPRYTVRAAWSARDPIAEGTEFDLRSTYCEATYAADGPIGFTHARGSEWARHPAYQAFHLESYLGAPVLVHGERWGTLNFSSPDARPREWSAPDLEAVQLMAAWAGAELGRRRVEAELRAALAEVDTLRGLLPICAGCKKVRERDPGGGEARWTPVERYVSQRSAAKFSHGMCPECARERYPDIDTGA